MDKKGFLHYIPVIATAILGALTLLTTKGYSASVSHKDFSASIHKEPNNDEEE